MCREVLAGPLVRRLVGRAPGDQNCIHAIPLVQHLLDRARGHINVGRQLLVGPQAKSAQTFGRNDRTNSERFATNRIRFASQGAIGGDTIGPAQLQNYGITDLDVQIKDGKVDSYRAKVKVSFKYEGGG